MRRLTPLLFALIVGAGLSPARADMLFFKDGFAVEGKVKREMTLEFDQVAREAYHMPKGFFYLDDGPRRIFFSPAQVRYVFPKDPPVEERIVCEDPRRQINPKKFPDLLEVVKAPEWDARWNRRFQFRSSHGVVENVPQHIGMLTPYWARADSPGRYFWACAYLTRELGPDVVQGLLATHPDFQDNKELASAQRASRRLRKADFYTQAGWPDLAEQELERLAADLPDQKDRVAAARKALAKLRARDRLEEIKRRHHAGQHRRVRKLLADFPADQVPENLLAELQELKAQYETTDATIAETARLLEAARKEAAGADGKQLAAIAGTLRAELNFENVARFDAFLGQARQAERLKRRGKQGEVGPEQLLGLAISGYLLGSASAESSADAALRLWRAREMVLECLRTGDAEKRLDLARRYQAGTRAGAASLDEIVQIVRTLPPPEAEKELPEGLIRGKADGAAYLLQLPPEYRHGRPYPLLIALPNAGESAKDMLDRWADAAAEHGYLLVAPEWQPAGPTGGYGYSDAEHAVVLNTLRDLRRRYNVDEDRVFLFGLGESGEMAFDVGLGHPDLFAGVLPMGAAPRFHAEICWRNGQYLPFYVAHGNRCPNGDHIRSQFETWVRRGFPMLWVDYKGRGVEWLGGEVANAFDWMGRQRRAFPLRQLGTFGGGGQFGTEFCTLRAGDNRFYWLSTDRVLATKDLGNWARRRTVQPASLHARIQIDRDKKENNVFLRTTGLGQVTVWFGRNSKGEDMIDFDLPVAVAGIVPQKVTPSLEVLMEDLYQRGDRQQLFLAKLSLTVQGGRYVITRTAALK